MTADDDGKVLFALRREWKTQRHLQGHEVKQAKNSEHAKEQCTSDMMLIDTRYPCMHESILGKGFP